jgi:3-methylfumaryl-CoA hydratase
MIEELARYRDWIGRSETRAGLITAYPADVFAATLDRDDAPLGDGDALPPGWHGFYFGEVVRLSETGADGHARKGGFMPPLPLPRRMWASSRMVFRAPLRIGETVRRVATITDVAPKAGKSGPLCFVTVTNEYFGAGGLAVEEIQTTVYRGPAEAGAKPPVPQPPPTGAVWHREVLPSTVLLFRYSALTMNSHRIHYDRVYATGAEGYPGLLVHGPLTMTLLLDLFRRMMPAATLSAFSVRAVAPLFDIAPFTLAGAPAAEGGRARLWAVAADGGLAMTAEAEFAG